MGLKVLTKLQGFLISTEIRYFKGSIALEYTIYVQKCVYSI